MRKKQVVIIESSVSNTLTKMALSLRERGYETVFISLTGGIEIEFLKKAYDKIISFESRFFSINLASLPKILMFGLGNSPHITSCLLQIKKLRPYIVIGRATPNWLCVIMRKIFKNSPFIYFPYDIRSFFYATRKHALSTGVPNFELNAEKYCFEYADGIIHKGAENELTDLNKDTLGEVKIRCPDIFFYPYCSKKLLVPFNKTKKLSSKDKKIHLVYAGYVPAEKDWVDGIKKITDQGLCLHLYSRTNNLTKEEEVQRTKPVADAIKGNKFAFLHESVDQDEISKEISKYDYGIQGYITFADKKSKYATGNKLSTYLEAGLPVLCPASYESIGKMVSKYKIGVIFEVSDLGKLKEIIKKNPVEKFKKDIINAREEMGMENQILRLEKFFNEVIRYHNEKNLKK